MVEFTLRCSTRVGDKLDGPTRKWFSIDQDLTGNGDSRWTAITTPEQ
jgi:hypothetical protein